MGAEGHIGVAGTVYRHARLDPLPPGLVLDDDPRQRAILHNRIADEGVVQDAPARLEEQIIQDEGQGDGVEPEQVAALVGRRRVVLGGPVQNLVVQPVRQVLRQYLVRHHGRHPRRRLRPAKLSQLVHDQHVRARPRGGNGRDDARRAAAADQDAARGGAG